MGHSDSQFDIKVNVEETFVLIVATGTYSLIKANNLFKLAVDNGIFYSKSKVLIDVTGIVGEIPFIDRYHYAEFLANYRIDTAFGKVNSIAVVGQEPIIHNEKFGETVAVNRGTNVRVFTDIVDALIWLNKQ